MLTHIDLFSGIGGFALAAQWAGFGTVVFCEIDEFCQEVLKARFGAVADTEQSGPHGSQTEVDRWGEYIKEGNQVGDGREPNHRKSPLIPDIRNFDGTRWQGATLLTGDFPCQPFSVAGKRRGKADDRAIWPEMLRVIHEARPHWVLAENVSGIIRMELDQVLSDLEMEGYTCRTFHIGAVGVNAPHRRMRVWIVAHAEEFGTRGGQGAVRQQERRQDDGLLSRSVNADSDAPITSGGKPRQSAQPEGREDTRRGSGEGGDVRNSIGGQFSWLQNRGFPQWTDAYSIGSSWDIPWIEVATRFCRVDDGLPAWIHARRVARLKALGNSVVPQIPFIICQKIAEIERAT